MSDGLTGRVRDAERVLELEEEEEEGKAGE
jgi:hypothetical protein